MIGHEQMLELKRWNCEVEVFGRSIEPGRLIHADKHGFLAVPEEDEDRLLDAVRFMDSTECQTLIAAARSAAGKSSEEILRRLADAASRFDEDVRKKFRDHGE